MRRTRFQQGSLQIVKRAGGRKAWEYRWYELQADGSRTRRNLMLDRSNNIRTRRRLRKPSPHFGQTSTLRIREPA